MAHHVQHRAKRGGLAEQPRREPIRSVESLGRRPIGGDEATGRGARAVVNEAAASAAAVSAAAASAAVIEERCDQATKAGGADRKEAEDILAPQPAALHNGEVQACEMT